MGRFFQTADPRFIEDFIYKPPYELMDQVATQRQNQYDKDVEEVALLDDPIAKVQYINDPYEREIVQKKADLYKTKVDELSKKLQSDPLNYQKYMGEINGLKSEISNDLLAGDLSKVQGSYNNYAQFMKDNEKNPYKDMAYQKLMRDWQNERGSLGKSFGYTKLVDRPDIDYEKFKLEPDKVTFENGKWIHSDTGVAVDRWQDAAEGAIRSHKDYIPYTQMMEGFFGASGYDLNKIPMFVETGFRLKDGSIVTKQQFEDLSNKANNPNLTAREKGDIYKALNGAKPLTQVNPYSAWYGEGLSANSKAYNQHDMKPNEIWETQYKEQQANARNNADNAMKWKTAKLDADTKIKLKGMEDVPNIQRIVDTNVDFNNRNRIGMEDLLVRKLGMTLSDGDRKRFENGGAYNVAREKILNSNVSASDRVLLLSEIDRISSNAKNAVSADDSEYRKIFKNQSEVQSTKNYTAKVMKENPSVFLNSPLMFNGKMYNSKAELEKAVNKKFTIGQDLVIKDESDGTTSKIKDKYVINPYTSTVIINNPNDLQSAENLRVMDLTADDGSIVTVYQRYGEFHNYKP